MEHRSDTDCPLKGEIETLLSAARAGNVATLAAASGLPRTTIQTMREAGWRPRSIDNLLALERGVAALKGKSKTDEATA